MRMWMVPPSYLCRQHLMGEHVELHMLVGCINKGRSIQGYIDKGLCEPHNIVMRHEQLVEEMLLRGYNHKSPLDFEWLHDPIGCIDTDISCYDLARRCSACFSCMVDSKYKAAQEIVRGFYA